jgi:N-glycosylase/DNA lyase
MDYETAHKALTGLIGVGDKVADCVLLFGCGHTEAYPVDVWIARITKSVFDIDSENRKLLGERARALLGKNAGILQQFLFHAARTGAMEV